jgi:hypothetical protein
MDSVSVIEVHSWFREVFSFYLCMYIYSILLIKNRKYCLINSSKRGYPCYLLAHFYAYGAIIFFDIVMFI